MKNKLRVIIVTLIISLVFPFTSFASDSSNGEKFVGLSNNVINLDGKSTMKVYDLMLFPTNQGNQLVFKADIFNASDTELSFIYYWLRVNTTQGTKHSVTMVDDGQGSVVSPRSTRTYIFTSTVDDDVELQDIKLQVIRWNFSVSGYEQLLGTVSVGESYNPTVSWESGKTVTIEKAPVQFFGNRYQSAKLGDYYEVKINLNVWNHGKFSVQIPSYKYFLQTEDGLIYPVTQSSKEVLVLPNSDEQISLQSKVPESVDLTKLRLIAVETIGSYEVPHFVMHLPSESSSVEEVHDQFNYDTTDGKYSVTITNLQRLPNNETDLISIELEVANKENEQPLPNIDLVASIELDNIVLEPKEVEGIRLDNTLNIKPGNQVTFIFNANIPYNFDFSQLRFHLSQKLEDESTVSVATFSNDISKFEIQSTGIIRTNTIGKKSTIYVLDYQVFNGSETDTLYTDIIMTNAEPRFALLEQLVAYYKINGDTYFPAEIPDNKVLTMPSGKALIPAYTEIPKGMEISSIELVLGTQLLDTDTYKQAYLMVLPENSVTVKDTFTELQIANYTISMEEVKLYVNGGSASLHFDYELSRDIFQHELAEHKFRITLVSGDRKYKHDLVLGKDLEVGKNSFEMPVVGSNFFTDVQASGYYIEIYDAFGNGEKLLAKSEKNYSWYSNETF